MKIIPVIDILNKTTVHAIRGNRREYKPIKSILCKSSDPIEISSRFRSLGFSEMYIADLDSIINKKPNFYLYQKIKSKTKLELMVDPGINNFITAENVLNNGASKIIIGTETMKNFGFIEQISKKIPVDKIIISIDMKNKKLLSRSRIIKLMSPMKFIKEVNDIGIKKIILLELTKVGSQEGVDIDFLDKVNDKLDIIVGG